MFLTVVVKALTYHWSFVRNLYFYKMKTYKVSCRNYHAKNIKYRTFHLGQKTENFHPVVKWIFPVFSPRWKVRVSQKNFTLGWISPRLRVTCLLALTLDALYSQIIFILNFSCRFSQNLLEHPCYISNCVF